MPNPVKRILAFAFAGGLLLMLARVEPGIAAGLAGVLLLGVVLINYPQVVQFLDGITAIVKS